MPNYVTQKEASEYFKISLHTLRRWEKRGLIKAIRTPSSAERRYDLDSWAGAKANTVVVYARVSSPTQKSDLNHQVAKLLELYPRAEGVAEIGGGLNFKRQQFLSLLERVGRGDVATIVVAHQDRLCRFGFDLVQWYCQRHGCQIVVLDDQELFPQQELVEDSLAILQCFSSRLYGLRKYKTAIQKDQDLSAA
ncbi:IS607 family transposase [Thermosynechococcus sp. HN-54]|uniref:IS607 family transposase n=1 Tax=Thermosynechococcus sp. HN-54 TaxID=2933959 RepID=UPI00202CAEC7|nr:IS607 family transposase [Thermosynechococcus sp. HN-54]URR34945.1 IS607 family transposase [Thermosynechococcus sp. HN-54]